MTVQESPAPKSPRGGSSDRRPLRRAGRAHSPRLRALAFSNISAVYVGIALIALFSIWIPSTFLTSSTLTTLLSEQAITGIIAVALVLPFAAGAFDLSFAYNVGFGAILAASLIGNHAFPSWALRWILIGPLP